jgi:hypothetical protein
MSRSALQLFPGPRVCGLLVSVRNTTYSARVKGRRLRSAANKTADRESEQMITILLVVLIVLLLFGGGGYYYRRYW